MMRPILSRSVADRCSLVIPLLACGYLAFKRLPVGFMPTVDEGGFVIDYVGPPGTSLAETDRLLRQVEAILQDTPEVQTYSRRTGFSLGGDFSEANMGDFFVRLKPFPRRADRRGHGRCREADRAHDPRAGDRVRAADGGPDRRPHRPAASRSSSTSSPMTRTTLAELPHEGRRRDRENPGRRRKSKTASSPPAMRSTIDVDRVKASLEGVDPDAITKSSTICSAATSRRRSSRARSSSTCASGFRKRSRARREIWRTSDCAPRWTSLPAQARRDACTTITGQPEITREDLKRVVSVTGAISDRDLGSTIRDVQKVLDQPGMLPPACATRSAGCTSSNRSRSAGC